MDVTRSLNGVRFLVVEDEIVQAMMLNEMLTDMGGVVSETAYGYEQASKAIHKESFDCAVLDINLGGTLSFPIADALKKRGVPFLFCTAFTAGVDAYPYASDVVHIEKPVRYEDLRAAVICALEQQNAELEAR
jgi:DNA-binding response OmpR family regulator